jgi:hypothetical protein
MRKLERLHAKFSAAKVHALRLIVLSAFLAAAIPFAPAIAQESPKWFVLRHDQSGDCWMGLLIEINGAYQHAFAQKAGGPYDTKAQALKREKELEQNGSCTKTTEQ